MITAKTIKTAVAFTAALAVSGCGTLNSGTSDSSVGAPTDGPDARDAALTTTSIWELFRVKNTETNVSISRCAYAAYKCSSTYLMLRSTSVGMDVLFKYAVV